MDGNSTKFYIKNSEILEKNLNSYNLARVLKFIALPTGRALEALEDELHTICIRRLKHNAYSKEKPCLCIKTRHIFFV